MTTRAVRTKNLKKPRNLRKRTRVVTRERAVTELRKGDPVMVLVGGNSKKGKVYAGKVGKISRVLRKSGRVIVEGVKTIYRHKRAMTNTDTAGKIEKDGSFHLSNVMYYSEELKKPVRLKTKILENGKKVRAFYNPVTKELQALEA